MKKEQGRKDRKKEKKYKQEKRKKCLWVVRIVAGRLNPQMSHGSLKIIQKGTLVT